MKALYLLFLLLCTSALADESVPQSKTPAERFGIRYVLYVPPTEVDYGLISPFMPRIDSETTELKPVYRLLAHEGGTFYPRVLGFGHEPQVITTLAYYFRLSEKIIGGPAFLFTGPDVRDQNVMAGLVFRWRPDWAIIK